MSGLQIPVTGISYEPLAAFLDSDRAPTDSMQMAEFDGFLTGVAIGPELIMPSEWLPVAWGGEGPVFESDEEAQSLFGAMMSRYNEIIRQAQDGTYEPIRCTTPEERRAWAEGFVIAMGLRLQAWHPLLKAKQAGWLLAPIFALCCDESGKSALDLGPEIERQMMKGAPILIPAAVVSIAAFWRERRDGRTGNLRVDRTTRADAGFPKAGRNEPCPCGSGKKFKRCCGV